MYDTDYELWLREQIQALQQGKLEALDIPHLIEELEGLNKSNKREMYSYLVMLLTHLLKWQYQPSLQSGNWEASIYISRKGIERVITDQPSLKNYWQEIVPKAYEEAKKLAQKETKLNFNLFPINPPYSINQLQDETWFP